MVYATKNYESVKRQAGKSYFRRAFLIGSIGLIGLSATAKSAYSEDSVPRPRDRSADLGAEAPRAASETAPETEALADLRRDLQAIWSGANLRLGTTAVYVVDAETGESLYSVHDSDALNPASNVKLISTGTVLATLGPDWTYKTRVLGAAPDANGVVSGGLYLHGNYDPTLGPHAFDELALELRAAGVTHIQGDIVLDPGARDELALSKIRVTVRGTAPGKPASVETWPASNFVTISSNRVRSKAAGRSKVHAKSSLVVDDAERPHIELQVRGTIRKGHTRILHIPIRRKASFTGSALQRTLQDAGITIDGDVRLASFSEFNEEEGRAGRIPFPLATHESRTIASLVQRVNKRSLNHLSDRLVMSAARSVYGGPLEMEKAVVLMKDWLRSIGVNADSVVLDTGSGLSYQTELSAKQIVRVLRAAGGFIPGAMPTSAVQSFRESLALGGVDGTLRRRFKLPSSHIEGRVLGKTGTLTRVIALSGFITREDGRTLCFSIVTNGHKNHRKRTVRIEHEHMVAELDEFLGKSAPPAAPVVDVPEAVASERAVSEAVVPETKASESF